MCLQDAVVQRFQELCEARNITPTRLARLSDVAPSTVQYLAKTNDVKLSTVKKLCDGLGITLGRFFAAPVFDALPPLFDEAPMLGE